MVKVLKKNGAIIHEVVYCPHKPKSGCACRKPNSKLIIDLGKNIILIYRNPIWWVIRIQIL